MKTAEMLTHALEYQQPDGTWASGHLGLTPAEAQDLRAVAMKRTGRAVRIVGLPSELVRCPRCGDSVHATQVVADAGCRGCLDHA